MKKHIHRVKKHVQKHSVRYLLIFLAIPLIAITYWNTIDVEPAMYTTTDSKLANVRTLTRGTKQSTIGISETELASWLEEKFPGVPITTHCDNPMYRYPWVSLTITNPKWNAYVWEETTDTSINHCKDLYEQTLSYIQKWFPLNTKTSIIGDRVHLFKEVGTYEFAWVKNGKFYLWHSPQRRAVILVWYGMRNNHLIEFSIDDMNPTNMDLTDGILAACDGTRGDAWFTCAWEKYYANEANSSLIKNRIEEFIRYFENNNL